MLRYMLLCFVIVVFAEEDIKTVILEEGGVQGAKYWNGEFYEFYGIPYAKVPEGRDRFQGPLPPEKWNNMKLANSRSSRCFQAYFTPDEEEPVVDGEEECLFMNLLVPKIASQDNLVPVVVYVHSGAFSGGNGNMAQFHYLARHDIIVASFNYRLGAIGFACLGTKEIPGNAGMKDQVAALKWINKNIARFGGDPKRVTIAGFSVGASMAELLVLSKMTDGLIDKLILESGSALSPFAINRDPVNTAKSIAVSLGFKDNGSIKDLTEFYFNATAKDLASKSQNYFLPNSTFGFSPCIENVHEGIEPFLTESPLDIINKEKNKQVAILTGFSNMEGLSRSVKFPQWREMMNENFSDFLPADLAFSDEKTRDDFIKKVITRYFKDEKLSTETLEEYVEYFSDSMFKYSIMKSIKAHAEKAVKPIFLYEFSYVGKLNMQHHYMERIKGASHRDQTAYILDFFGYTNRHSDMDMRDRMTTMWSDFVKFENPTAYESQLIEYKWSPYTNEDPKYLQIKKKPKMSKNLFEDGFAFWNEVYEKYYWNPTAPVVTEINEEPVATKKSKNITKNNENDEIINDN